MLLTCHYESLFNVSIKALAPKSRTTCLTKFYYPSDDSNMKTKKMMQKCNDNKINQQESFSVSLIKAACI